MKSTLIGRCAVDSSATVGVAIAAAGHDAVSYGEWSSGVAWSTCKVPLVIAARRAGVGDDELAASTICRSDNVASEHLWAMLGDPLAAAQQLQTVIREAGDPVTTVEPRRTRAGYTAFGQTQWSLAGQARFAAGLTQLAGACEVVGLMTDLCAEHQWGLAAKGYAAKGGWGPGVAGEYLVRQFGIVSTATGNFGLALAAEVPDGGYRAGVDVINDLTEWVVEHFAELSQQ
jgi:hypothetical protein